MTSSERPNTNRGEIEPRPLEELREIHGLDESWDPRFTADTPIAEQRAEEYRDLGFDVEVLPHPDDAGSRRIPGRGDRCVVYTKPIENGGSEMADDLF